MNNRYTLLTPIALFFSKHPPNIAYRQLGLRAGVLATLMMSIALMAHSQTTFDWMNTAPDGNWRQGSPGARWWDGSNGLWDEPGFGIIRFNNNHQLSMNNNVSGTYNQHQIVFGSFNTSNRTIDNGTIRLFDFNNNDPKIENLSTGSHTINTNIEGDGDAADPLELNPISGDLTFGGTVNNQGSDLLIYGDNGHTIRFDEVISGSGKLVIQQYSIAVLDAVNTYSGNTEIDEGELWIDADGDIDDSSSIYLGNGGETGNFTKFFLADDNGGFDFTRDITVNNGNPNTRTIGTLNTSGTNTFSGNVNSSAAAVLRLEVPNANGTMDMAGQISGVSNELRKIGAGKVIYSGNQTYTGSTSVIAGTLELGAADRINDGSRLIMAGGTFSTGATTGHNETLGSLQLTANSTIALGTGNHTLSFDASNALGWTGGATLTITGWQGDVASPGTAGRIFVGNNASALTAAQLAAISFQGFDGSAILLPTGELVPGYTHNWTGNTSTDWHTATNWQEGSVPDNISQVFIPAAATNFPTISSNASVRSLTIASGATLTISGSTTLNIADAGRLENQGSFQAGSGTVEFDGAGTIVGSITFYGLTLNGAVTFSNAVTIHHQLLINSNGAVLTNAPTYAAGSTLIYNSGNNYIAATEWTANAASGQGVPHHVQVGNGVANTELQFNNTGYRQCNGDMTIGHATGSGCLLRLNSSDLRLAGDYTFVNGASVNNDGRAVFFVGSADQEISTDAVQVFFDYLIINKPLGNVVMQDPVTINTTTGEMLQLLNVGGLDLNGHRLRLNNDGGNILTNGTGRTIFSGVAGGEVFVDGEKDIITNASGTLIFGENVLVEISSTVFSSVNFGSGISTVNGELLINAGGFVDAHAPTYGSNATLIYRGNTTFNAGVEWSPTLNDVVVESGITLNTGGFSSSSTINGNLTIESGATLGMGASPHTITVRGNLTNQGTINLSTQAGGDLDVEGDISNTGTFNSNGRALFLTGVSQQTLNDGALTTDFLILDNPAGLVINQDLTVGQTLTMTKGNITTGSHTLTLGNSTTPGTLAYSAGLIIGQFRRYFADAVNSGNATGLFPLGNGAGDNRHVLIEYTTAPAAGGYLTAQVVGTNMGLEGIKDAGGNYLIGESAVGACPAFTVRSTANEYWSIDDDASLSGGNYTISMTMQNPTGVTSLCELRLLKRVGAGSWEAPGTHAAPTGSISAPTISASGVSGFSNFGFGGDGPGNPLPIELLSFRGAATPQGSELTWEVANAKDFAGFSVERKAEGGVFQPISYLPYQQGQQRYAFLDQALDGLSYYRLRLIDQDGSHAFSRVISVSPYQTHAQAPQLRSNVGDGRLFIIAPAFARLDLRLFNLHGQQLGYWAGDAQQVAQQASELLTRQESGLYFIRLRHDGKLNQWKYLKK